MKHYPAGALERATKAAQLLTEDDLKAQLRARLAADAGNKSAVAESVGIRAARLSSILRGVWPVSDDVAQAMGYRKVVRFEPID
jgi:hypothetical protein